MGNIISFDDKMPIDDDSLKMSNGLTDVLIDYLLISGSELAVKESEKRFIAFFAEKQQAVIGLGTVGFRIVNMPWEINCFYEDKAFLLKVIEQTRILSTDEKVWNKLGYQPLQEHIEYALNGLEALIKRMTIKDVNENNLLDWLSERDEDDPVCCGFPKCKKHDIILSFFGCKLCNDKG